MNTALSSPQKDESKRLARLRALMVLDTEPESIFDALARAASTVCGTPTGLITLIDQDRQWFKARVGLDAEEVPRNISFCAYTVLGDALIEVSDATLDARFANNPLVTSNPGFRFYAGTPLVMSSGDRVGTLCVLDTLPHHLTDAQHTVLRELANTAVLALEMRERAREVAIAGADPKFQALSDACPFGIFHTDLEGRCTYTNPRWQELWGLEYEESLGEGWVAALHPDDRAELFTHWQQCAASGHEFDMEFRICHASGDVFYLRAKARSYTDFTGKPSGYVGAVYDVTERRKAEDHMRASEERLTRALDATGLALWDYDVERGQVYLSESWSALLGGPQQATVITVEELAAQVPKQDQAALQTALISLLKGNAPDYSVDHRVRRHDGQLIWIHSDGKVTRRNSSGRALRLVGTNREITRQKTYERHLQAAKDTAEQAMQAKSAFLAAMSHEIRTPMNGVVGMTRLLMDTPLGDRQREFVEIIRQSGEGLLVVINDILDYSKIESGHMELEHLPFDLRDTVESSVELLALKAQEKNLDVLCDVAGDIPRWIEGDYARLRQVLVNLISNAVKFTNEGTVQVGVRQIPGDSTGRGFPLQLEFCVRDTGIGIPADKLPRLFQAFSQADSSTSRKYGGTGLGLVISQRLVEAMKGRMWVESDEGQGTRFFFTLPTSPAIAMNAPPPLALERLRKKRVLLVDDNPACLQWLCQLARRWDMEVTAAGSGEEALAVLKTPAAGLPCDLLVTDLTMPGMDGLALTRAVRTWQANAETGRMAPRLPVILLSGGGMPAREDVSLFEAVVIKPVRESVFALGLIEALAERGTAPAVPVVMGRQFDASLAQRYPQRILLAEDNEINREVAIEMLKGFGYIADTAADGLEAVDAVRRQPYDLVLMDIQMPEMDGIEATRILVRNRSFGGIPRIVGMSAHAMREDIDAALASGMDDYIVKPFTVEALRNKLVYFGQRIAGAAGRAAGAPLKEAAQTGSEPPAPVSTQAPAGDHDLLDLKQVHSLILLDPSGKLMEQLADGFGLKTSKLLADLRVAAKAHDAYAAGRLVHQFKGTAGTLGMRSLARLGAEMEVSLAAGLWAQLGVQLANADDRCTSSLSALKLEIAIVQPALAVAAAEGVSR